MNNTIGCEGEIHDHRKIVREGTPIALPDHLIAPAFVQSDGSRRTLCGVKPNAGSRVLPGVLAQVVVKVLSDPSAFAIGSDAKLRQTEDARGAVQRYWRILLSGAQ